MKEVKLPREGNLLSPAGDGGGAGDDGGGVFSVHYPSNVSLILRLYLGQIDCICLIIA